MKKLLFAILLLSGFACQAQDLITLGPDNIINLNNKQGSSNYTTALLDEQGADPVNGIMTPVPHTPFKSGYPTHPGYPAIVMIDLKAVYDLSEIAMYSSFGVDDINFEFSNDSTSWSGKTTYHPSGSGFFYLKVDQVARYVKVYNSNKGYQKVMELYLYGNKVNITVPPEAGSATIPRVLKTYTIELMSDSTFQVKQ